MGDISDMHRLPPSGAAYHPVDPAALLATVSTLCFICSKSR